MRTGDTLEFVLLSDDKLQVDITRRAPPVAQVLEALQHSDSHALRLSSTSSSDEHKLGRQVQSVSFWTGHQAAHDGTGGEGPGRQLTRAPMLQTGSFRAPQSTGQLPGKQTADDPPPLSCLSDDIILEMGHDLRDKNLSPQVPNRRQVPDVASCVSAVQVLAACVAPSLWLRCITCITCPRSTQAAQADAATQEHHSDVLDQWGSVPLGFRRSPESDTLAFRSLDEQTFRSRGESR